MHFAKYITHRALANTWEFIKMFSFLPNVVVLDWKALRSIMVLNQAYPVRCTNILRSHKRRCPMNCYDCLVFLLQPKGIKIIALKFAENFRNCSIKLPNLYLYESKMCWWNLYKITELISKEPEFRFEGIFLKRNNL